MKIKEIKYYLANSRVEPEKHFEIESKCLFKTIRSVSSISYGFDFMLAHILKHGMRNIANNLFNKKSNNAETKKQSEEHFKYMTGWADEFYWLSLWELTGEVLPENVLSKLKKIEEPYNQILGAFIQADWADLILKAYQTLRINPIKIVDRKDTSFGIWIAGENTTLSDSLLLRCIKRYGFAEAVLKHIRRSEDSVFRKALGDNETRRVIDKIESKICFGIAYIKRAIEGKIHDEQKKIHEQIIKSGEKGFLKLKINDLEKKAFMLADETDKEIFKREIKDVFNAINVNQLLNRHEQGLARLHILAEWIGDLLKTEDGFQHLRYYLSPKEYPQSGCHQKTEKTLVKSY